MPNDSLYEAMVEIRPLIEATTLNGHNARVEAMHYVVRQLHRMVELEERLAAANALLKQVPHWQNHAPDFETFCRDIRAHFSGQKEKRNG